MSVVKDIFKAYKESGQRNPEFDSMIDAVMRELGASESDVVELLSHIWDAGGAALPAARASMYSKSDKDGIQLFKSANTEASTEDPVAAINKLFSGLKEAIKAGDRAKIQAYSGVLGEAALNPQYKNIVSDLVEEMREAEGVETIDDMPVAKAIKDVNKDAFDNIFGKSADEAAGSVRYVPRVGHPGEAAELIKELERPNPHPEAVNRFKAIANAKISPLGSLRKESQTAEWFIREIGTGTHGEAKLARILARIRIPVDDAANIVANFNQNAGSRLEALTKSRAGWIGSLEKILTKSKYRLTTSEKLLEALKLTKGIGSSGISMLKSIYILPRILSFIPVIGKPLGFVIQTGLMGGAALMGHNKLFGDDDDKPDVSAPVEAPAGNGSVPGSIADPALAGNLHQKMRTILKRTFGPR